MALLGSQRVFLSSKLQRDSWGAEQAHVLNKAEGAQQFRHQQCWS